MKYVLLFLWLGCFANAQTKIQTKKSNRKTAVSKKNTININRKFSKINDSIAALIPQKLNGKYGFINQESKLIIKHEYSNVGFFTEDCHLQNSPNIKVRKFGSQKYASVRLEGEDFRIDEKGKRVYHFKDGDLGKCMPEFKSQLFHAYILNKLYGIIEDSKFFDASDYKQYTIYPQYDYLHILEGDDLKNPMIVAISNEKFGIIDIHQNTIIPFIYSDIKRNYSWKLARLFEVSTDGENYFFIDIDNKKY